MRGQCGPYVMLVRLAARNASTELGSSWLLLLSAVTPLHVSVESLHVHRLHTDPQ